MTDKGGVWMERGRAQKRRARDWRLEGAEKERERIYTIVEGLRDEAEAERSAHKAKGNNIPCITYGFVRDAYDSVLKILDNKDGDV